MLAALDYEISSPAHLCFAPNRARTNTAVNADPTIAIDLMTTNVRAVSASAVMSSPWTLADIAPVLVNNEQALRHWELSKLPIVFGSSWV